MTFKRIYLLDGLFVLIWLYAVAVDLYAKYVLGIGDDGTVWTHVSSVVRSLSLALTVLGLYFVIFRGFSMSKKKPAANAAMAGWDAAIVHVAVSRIAINLTASTALFVLAYALPIGNVFKPLAIVVGVASAAFMPKFVLHSSLDMSTFTRDFVKKVAVVALIAFVLGPLGVTQYGDRAFSFVLAIITCGAYLASLWYQLEKKEEHAN